MHLIGKSNSLKSSVDMNFPYSQNGTNVYRFGFNGQEKDNEVAGFGNITTAEFWEYDCRLEKPVKLTTCAGLI